MIDSMNVGVDEPAIDEGSLGGVDEGIRGSHDMGSERGCYEPIVRVGNGEGT